MFKTWFVAMRPWSFTASFIPIALGTALAWNEGSLNWPLFFFTLMGGIAVHAGTNFINTYGDYVSGVDTIESAKTCPQLVTETLSPQAMKRAGVVAFIIAASIGLLLTYLRGWPIFFIGMIGIIGGYSYTAGFSPYKYKGLGTFCVFFLMGPLMVWPAYYIQTGQYSLLPVWVSLPVGLLVAGILHANDIRDMAADRQAGINTLALFLGLDKSVVLYVFLYTMAFVSLIALVLLSLLPWTAILPLALVPVIRQMLLQVLTNAKMSRETLERLEPAAAKFHFQFGFLLVAGIALYPLLQRWHS